MLAQEFPYRLYFMNDDIAIIISAVSSQNQHWIPRLLPKKSRKVVIIFIVGFYIQYMDGLQRELAHIPDSVEYYILCNDLAAIQICKRLNLRHIYCNQNAFLDENLFTLSTISYEQRQYRAVLNARLLPYKRPWLAANIANLAVLRDTLDPTPQKQHYLTKLDVAYINPQQLTPLEVSCFLEHCQVGLSLSSKEGACYAVGEYLLKGIPVVSTQSEGGRAVWLNASNSITCQATPQAVGAAVEQMIELAPSPAIIRQLYLLQQQQYLTNFIKLTARLWQAAGVNINAHDYFYKHRENRIMHRWQPLFYIEKIADAAVGSENLVDLLAATTEVVDQV